ncbi:MAG: hypothetical protein ACR2GR_02730 [Rhodothermales bacterium]
MRNRLFFALLPLLFLLPLSASAQNAIGPHLGYNLDNEELFIGATAHINIPALPVIINPAFDYYLGTDNFTLLQFDANALLTFGVANVLFSPYAGGGLALSYASYNDDALEDLGLNVDNSSTDVGLNLLAGTFFNLAALRPFAEARVTIGDGTTVAVKGGVMFNF